MVTGIRVYCYNNNWEVHCYGNWESLRVHHYGNSDSSLRTVNYI